MKVEFVNLDEETVKRAEAYIPLAEKYAVSKILGQGCIEKEDQDPEKMAYQPIPPKWHETIIGKRMVMMYVLVGLYLRLIDAQELYEDVPKITFSTRQYDQYSQVFAQLERYKKHKDEDVRNKAYAILADYREFERVLSAEIYNILNQKNDLCVRLMGMIEMQTNPETVRTATEQLKKVAEELQAQQKVHAQIVGNGRKGA